MFACMTILSVTIYAALGCLNGSSPTARPAGGQLYLSSLGSNLAAAHSNILSE